MLFNNTSLHSNLTKKGELELENKINVNGVFTEEEITLAEKKE